MSFLQKDSCKKTQPMHTLNALVKDSAIDC